MRQCPHCGSYNDGEAAFCNQCGGRLGVAREPSSAGAVPARARTRAGPPRRGRRGWVGSLLLTLLLALLVGVILVLERAEEPGGTLVRPAAPPEDGPPVQPDSGPEEPPTPTPVTPPTPEPTPSVAERAKRVSSLVAPALVILELRDGQQRTTEQRGVLVDESGVVLCRFEPLIGARSGTARLLTREGVRADILGLAFRDEASDLALLRLAPVTDAFPWLPLAAEDPSSALDEGEELFVFSDYRAIPAVIAARDHVGADGLRRLLLGQMAGGPALPPQVFLVVEPGARVLGLCRSEEVVSPEAEAGVADLFRLTVDEASPLRESLHLPVGLTLDELTERLYAGTFPDLYERGRRAYRQEEWRTAIELLEGALDRVALDEPPEDEVDDASASLRESYLREADRLAKARRHRDTVRLAEAAVGRFGSDPALWRLLGEARLALDQNADGIAALLESRSLEPSRNVDEALEEAYLKIAAGHARGGEDRLAELALLEGLETVPGSADLYIELARLYTRFEAYDDAIRLLEQARGLDATLSEVIDALLERIDDALKRRDAVIIPLTSSNSIRARVVVDGQLELSFIIDTGATYTAIPESAAIQLGYDTRRADRVQVRTANGLMAVPVVDVQSVSLGGYIVRNLKVLALPDRIAPGVHLLGLNYLNHFKYTVDAQRREFRLERP